MLEPAAGGVAVFGVLMTAVAFGDGREGLRGEAKVAEKG
jgi:hypothetical protein